MANGTNYDHIAAAAPSSYLVGADWEGKVRAMYDTYTFDSSSSGTTVNVGVLRAGETFLGADIVLSATLGSGTTLSLGDAGSATRYMAATASTAAGTLAAKAFTGVGYKAAADTVIFVTLGGGTATGQFKIVISKLASN
jgi:hypothetical protein